MAAVKKKNGRGEGALARDWGGGVRKDIGKVERVVGDGVGKKKRGGDRRDGNVQVVGRRLGGVAEPKRTVRERKGKAKEKGKKGARGSFWTSTCKALGAWEKQEGPIKRG